MNFTELKIDTVWPEAHQPAGEKNSFYSKTMSVKGSLNFLIVTVICLSANSVTEKTISLWIDLSLAPAIEPTKMVLAIMILSISVAKVFKILVRESENYINKWSILFNIIGRFYKLLLSNSIGINYLNL